MVNLLIKKAKIYVNNTMHRRINKTISIIALNITWLTLVTTHATN